MTNPTNKIEQARDVKRLALLLNGVPAEEVSEERISKIIEHPDGNLIDYSDFKRLLTYAQHLEEALHKVNFDLIANQSRLIEPETVVLVQAVLGQKAREVLSDE